MKKIVVFVSMLLAGCLLVNRVSASSCHGGSGGGYSEDSGYSGHEEKLIGKSEGKKIDIKESFYSTIYTCPMHPEMQQEKSGKCPKCGMKLEKKRVLMTYTCPERDCMFHRATMDKCPKHNKELIKTEMNYHCPKCGEQVNPEDLKLKPVK
ncbi:MAG: hypothetical protein HY919_00645 [Elusimicrobia bacterium]|nr:hypothetical protein [Elusimicrobiota bacterium]